MIESLILVQGENVREGNLLISLGNAKQLLIGSATGFGVILHIAADSSDDLRDALIEFAKFRMLQG